MFYWSCSEREGGGTGPVVKETAAGTRGTVSLLLLLLLLSIILI